MEPEGTKGWLAALITEAATRVLDFGRVSSNDLRQVWEILLKRLLWASLLLALWTSHPRLSVIKATKAGLLLFLDPGPPRKPSWGLAMVDYIRQCGRKVRGLEHLYLLRPGPCWSDEDPKMEREGITWRETCRGGALIKRSQHMGELSVTPRLHFWVMARDD